MEVERRVRPYFPRGKAGGFFLAIYSEKKMKKGGGGMRAYLEQQISTPDLPGGPELQNAGTWASATETGTGTRIHH